MFYVLHNGHGMSASFSDYGARWTGFSFPDAAGCPGNVVLGFENESDYACAREQYHGAIVGRVCGRTFPFFELEGTAYRLSSNDSLGSDVKNHLHGGFNAFHNRTWTGKFEDSGNGEESVVFSLFSPDGDEGYPGNLLVKVRYTLTYNGTLRMTIDAETDRLTLFNPTNHAFFNLNPGGDILGHRLTIAASSVLECDENLLPTGNFLPLDGSSLDFRRGRVVATSFHRTGSCVDSQIISMKGYTAAFVLDGDGDDNAGVLRFAVRLESSESGRAMEIYTDRPSLQVYNGYYMDGTDVGRGGVRYFANSGLALEPQGFPDAVHFPEFPSIFIRPEQPFHSETEYRFMTVVP